MEWKQQSTIGLKHCETDCPVLTVLWPADLQLAGQEVTQDVASFSSDLAIARVPSGLLDSHLTDYIMPLSPYTIL